MINPGKLKHKIIIQKIEIVTTEDGFKEKQWINWRTLWARKNNLWGKEFYAAKSINEETTVEFTVRYIRDFNEMNSTEYCIFHEGKHFDITFIDNIRYDNQWVVIKTIVRS